MQTSVTFVVVIIRIDVSVGVDIFALDVSVVVGVAVAVEDGLVVPVLRFTDEQTLPQIGAAVKDYAIRARNKKLTPQEMEGSTFTISNLGIFRTPVLRQP